MLGPNEPSESSLKMKAGTAVSMLGGLVFLVTGYFTSDASSLHYSLFWSFMFTNIGALLVFSGGYTLISELYLKQSFIREILKSVLKGELDQSILSLGLSEIQAFSAADLNRLLRKSSKVEMIVMRSDSFFSSTYEQLRLDIKNRRLNLQRRTSKSRNSKLMEVFVR